jgi:hypothetical protein
MENGFQCNITFMGGTRQRGWLKHYATSRRVAGLIPDEVIGFFNWYKPSNRTNGSGVDTASNRNEFHEPSGGGG